jgi:outer membrane protein OmpA-like peptidoglycan-associated protein
VETPKVDTKIEEKRVDIEPKIEEKAAEKTTEGYSISVDAKPQVTPSVIAPSRKESEAEIHYLQRIQTMLDEGKLPNNKSFIIENAHYNSFASTEITADLALGLDKIAEFLTRNRKLSIDIKEHTETKDIDATRAKQISTARVNNIVKYLVAQGVNAKRINSQGVGKAQPLKDCSSGNCTTEEDERNRRTELFLSNN